MSKSNKKKTDALGMPLGTASGRLKKALMFKLVVRLHENYCYQCEGEILSVGDLSVEHKEPWMQADDPVKSFFDLDNVAFSHLSCNSAAASRPTKIIWVTEDGKRKHKNKLERKAWRKRQTNVE